MPHLFATLVCVLALTMFAPACSHVEPPEEISSWSVQLKTSGGFIGIGRGNLLVSSDGKMTYWKASQPGKTQPPCDGQLSSDTVRALTEAVKQSKPTQWSMSELNIPAPDAYGYGLELVINGKAHKIQWYDNTAAKIPDDLRKLTWALNMARSEAVKKCGE